MRTVLTIEMISSLLIVKEQKSHDLNPENPYRFFYDGVTVSLIYM